MAPAPVRLSLKGKESFSLCDIQIEEGVLGRIRTNLESLLEDIPSSIVIITDSNLKKKYGENLRRQLSKYTKTDLVSFNGGEKRKTFATVAELLAKLASLKVDRKGVVVCLGGGVVGDLGGFVSSIYKRGIRYFQVPTTLLAQVDSSIGGKTGFDADWGKNQIGTFYQPRGVFIDPLSLDTLPKSEVINGLGEIIKYSVIASRPMFEKLAKSNMDSVCELKQFVAECCRIKVRVVSKDEREDNLRSILNYGHTVGHALEAASDYSLNHGKSVILGMLAEGWIAMGLGFFGANDFERQEALLSSFKFADSSLRLEKRGLLVYALADKKSSLGVMRMSLPEKIGKMHMTEGGSYLIPVSKKLFKGSINYLLEFCNLTRCC
ncbi:MAG: 3-dehydroquinate synthase [Nitrososphaerales archaeon]